jgi:hypothetical protein
MMKTTTQTLKSLVWLVFAGVVSGCTSDSPLWSGSTGQVIDAETNEPIADVYMLIQYRSESQRPLIRRMLAGLDHSTTTDKCYAATSVKTDSDGYFTVPPLPKEINVLAKDPFDGWRMRHYLNIEPHKKGYLRVWYDPSDPEPANILSSSLDITPKDILKNNRLPDIGMFKDNMSPILRYQYMSYKDLLYQDMIHYQDCGGVINESLAHYFVVLKEELDELLLQGVTGCETYPNLWYGPGAEGRKKEEAAGKEGLEWDKKHGYTHTCKERAEEELKKIRERDKKR